MNVDRKRQDAPASGADLDKSEGTSSAALPPTLFSLPNLSALHQSCQDPPCGQSEPEPVNADRTPTVEQTPTVEETAVDFKPIADEPNQASPEPTPQRRPSLLDVWGTRAVVIGLLLLAVTSAMLAARKSRTRPDQQHTVAEQKIDDSMLEGFAISDGIAVAEDEMFPASSVESLAVTADPPAAHSDQTASELQAVASQAAPIGATAVLSPPLVDATADSPATASPGEPTAEVLAATGFDASFGPAEAMAAEAASTRLEASQFPAGPPTLNEPTATAAATAAATATEPQTPEIAWTQSIAPVVANEMFATAAEAATTEVAKPATSNPVRYTSTPNRIRDLIRFLPPPISTTPTP